MEKKLNYNANILLKPYFKECLRIGMINVRYRVDKYIEDPTDEHLQFVYSSALPITSVYKAITGIENCNLSILINTLETISEFANSFALHESDKHKELKFKFYKLSCNTDRVISVLNDDFNSTNLLITVSENSKLVEYMHQLNDEESPYVNTKEFFYSSVDSIGLKHVFNETLFNTSFKAMISAVVYCMMNTHTSQEYDKDIIHELETLMTLYNTKIIYKDDSVAEFTKMLKHLINKFERFLGIINSENDRLGFGEDDIAMIECSKRDCEHLFYIFNNDEVIVNEFGFFNFNESLDLFLQDHHA